MPVTSTLTKVIAEGNGTATEFSFSPIVIFSELDLEVIHVDEFGVETTLSLGSDYTVAASTSFPGTGSITYPVSGDPLPSGEKLVIKRVLPLTQTKNLKNQGGYFPNTIEEMVDRLTMQVQQLQDEIDRSVKVPIGSAVDVDELVSALLQAEANAEAAQAAAEAAAAEAVQSLSPWECLDVVAVPNAATFEALTELGDTSHMALQIRVIGLTIDTDARYVRVRYRKDGDVKDAGYLGALQAVDDADAENVIGASAFTEIGLTLPSSNWDLGNAAGEHVRSVIEIDEPHEAKRHHASVESSYVDSQGDLIRLVAGYTYTGDDETSPITGLQFSLGSTGNFSGGKIVVLGLRDPSA